MRILGIDPGLNATGYGIIQTMAGRIEVIVAGDLRPPRPQPLGQRLEYIHDRLTALISRHQPGQVVLEKLFTHHRHVTTAAMMGHARGVACLVVQEHSLPLAEYAPTQWKKSLTGNGAASKEQVARMVGRWLRATEASWSLDATDALALAIVHAHHAQQRERLPAEITG